MGLVNSVKKRWAWARHVHFDKRTGFFRYQRFGTHIYIRHPRHYVNEADSRWVCESIFFHHYKPTGNDVVLDLGAGYGEEAAYLVQSQPKVRYIGVEAQPVIYECLANTFHDLGGATQASPYVISERRGIKFVSQFSYASVGEIPQGYIDVPTLPWEAFLDYYGIGEIDLFKMNIEGAERDVIGQIKDFSRIRRFIISCHDFRANDGEGDWFRTREFVTQTLVDNGYRISSFSYGINWADDWIYAER